jgi:hypothetical protein
MRPPLEDAVTEPDGALAGPVNTEERNIGALLEGLDEPQPPPARGSGSDLGPRAQLDTALLPDVDRRQRRKGAVLGLVIGLTVTFVAGTLTFRGLFATPNADAAATISAAPTSARAGTGSATGASSSMVVAAPSATWASTWTAPAASIPSVAASSLPAVPATSAPPAAGGATGAPVPPPVAKRPTRPTSSSPAEPRRGYGLTSDEP